MLVTIILLAKTVGLDSVDCLADAYDEIKERKGKMVDGLFVKDDPKENRENRIKKSEEEEKEHRQKLFR